MRTSEQSFDLISRQLKNSADHLNRHSTRKDLAEGNYMAIQELERMKEQFLGYQTSLESYERKILKMLKIWNDHLLRIYLFLCFKGYSSSDFTRILQQPIDFLIGPFEASLKSEIEVEHFTHQEYNSVEEGIALSEVIERKCKAIEQQTQNDLMATKRQIESLITKSINS